MKGRMILRELTVRARPMPDEAALAMPRPGPHTRPMPLDARDAATSFYRMRQALGWLGLALPAVLIAGTLLMGDPLPPALSDFYYGPLGDIFVGIMVTIGFFLLTYLGHREPATLLSDRNVSSLAGLAAVGVALFPNDTLDPCLGVKVPTLTASGLLHVGSAGVFLGCTAVFCLFLFRRTDGPPSPAKRRRNRIYLLCGLAIGLALLGLVVFFVVPTPEQRCAMRALRPVLWLEVLTIVAFGVSWLVKGRGVRALNEGHLLPGEAAGDRAG